MNKEEIIFEDYESCIEDIKLIDYEMWAIFLGDTNEWWWANKIIGFGKCFEHSYNINLNKNPNMNLEQFRSMTIEWKPIYLDEFNNLRIIEEGATLIMGKITPKIVRSVIKKEKDATDKIKESGLFDEGEIKDMEENNETKRI